ncbi:MAG: hypothetical protein WCP19_14060 [Chloroflexota bacterium]
MNKDQIILKWSLFAGGLYFFSVSVVHMLGSKLPVLFIYYNVPSYTYQDRIISFLAFGWSAFFFTAFLDPQKQTALIKTILVSGAFAIFGLGIINLKTDFHTLDPIINPNIFWLETSGLLIYWLWLVIFSFRNSRA